MAARGGRRSRSAHRRPPGRSGFAGSGWTRAHDCAKLRARSLTMTTLAWRRLAFIVGVLAISALVVPVPIAQEHHGPHWSYGGSDGPKHWGELDKTFSACRV